jgi:molybdopterin synthase sulfur carrier subunit
MTLVRIPPTLRPETGGQQHVQAEGQTVRDLFDDLVSRFPALQRQLDHANVYVDREDIRTLDGMDTPIHHDSEVILLPAMAGGLALLVGGDSRRANRRWTGQPSRVDFAPRASAPA